MKTSSKNWIAWMSAACGFVLCAYVCVYHPPQADRGSSAAWFLRRLSYVVLAVEHQL